MSVWRTGRKLGVTLYRDEVFVGHVCSAMVAAEIVETMNRVGRLLDEVRPVERQRREAAGERSQAGRVIARATCGRCERVVGVTDDGRLIHHDGSVNRYCNGSQELADPQPRDAERRSEATPQKDLQKRTDEEAPAADPNRWPPRENCYCGPPDYSLYAHRVGTGPHCRDQGQLSRVDPYDTQKGFPS